MTASILPAGTVVDGRYTLSTVAWQRRGAVTYEATGPEGSLWLTVYDPSSFSSPLVVERSLRELRQLSGVRAPGVTAVLASGKLPQGGIYEVNSRVSGQALAQRVAEGPLAPGEAAGILRGVGNALTAALQVGVTHRNLSAGCIFLTPQGVQVLGFAVGEPLGEGAFGPPDTVAPEQVEGKVVDQRTLVFNVAALAHAMLSGRPLFASFEEGKAAASKGIVPEGVDPRLSKALSPDPRLRPMMLGSFVAELANALGGPSHGGASTQPDPSAQPQPSQAASPSAGGQPSTRGWTMFMDAADAGTQPSQPQGGRSGQAPGPGPAPAPAQPAQPAQPQPAQPVGGAGSGASAGAGTSPSTRGWTMFMEPAPAAPEGAGPGKSTAAWDRPAGASPSEPAPGAAAAGTTAETGGSPSSVSREAPATGGATEAKGARKPSTRGWTMFMEAPLPGTGKDGTPAADPSSPGEGTPSAQQPGEGRQTASDAKGWTVFMEGGPREAPGGGGDRPGMVSGERSADSTPAAEGGTPPAKGKTVIAHGLPAVSVPPAATSSGTGEKAPQQDSGTTYFAQPQGAVERVGTTAAARPVTEPGVAPPSGEVVVERMARELEQAGSDAADEGSGDLDAADEDVVLAKQGANTGLIVAVAVVVVGVLVAAALFFL